MRDRLEEFAFGLRDRLDKVAQERRQELRAFSAVLQQKVGAHDRASRRLDRYLSTGFNVFTFIGRDENRLSDVFADVLDPEGTHGQGDRFLRAFVKLLSVDVPEAELNAVVTREVNTTRTYAYTRRIDVLVEFGGNAVAIENKPQAADQVNQIGDYAWHLARRYPLAWRLVYLTPDGREPSGTSIDRDVASSYRHEQRLVEWSYAEHIVPWLTSCIESCDSEKYRWFLRDLREHLTREFPLSTEVVQDGVD